MSATFKDHKIMYWLVLGEPSIGLILSLQLTLQLYNWQLFTTIHQPRNHLTPVSYPLAKVSDTTLTNLNHQSSQGGLLIPTNPLWNQHMCCHLSQEHWRVKTHIKSVFPVSPLIPRLHGWMYTCQLVGSSFIRFSRKANWHTLPEANNKRPIFWGELLVSWTALGGSSQ